MNNKTEVLSNKVLFAKFKEIRAQVALDKHNHDLKFKENADEIINKIREEMPKKYDIAVRNKYTAMNFRVDSSIYFVRRNEVTECIYAKSTRYICNFEDNHLNPKFIDLLNLQICNGWKLTGSSTFSIDLACLEGDVNE